MAMSFTRRRSVRHRLGSQDSIGGDLRYEDFASHHGEWVTPLALNYRGYEVHELPPNGQGAAVLQMLQILKGDDLFYQRYHLSGYSKRSLCSSRFLTRCRGKQFDW